MFRYDAWSSDEENIFIPRSRSQFVPVQRRKKRSKRTEYVCRILRPTPVAISVRTLCSYLRWTYCNGNIYGLEVLRNDLDELDHLRGLSSKRHKIWVFNVAAKMWKLRHLKSSNYFDLPVDLGVHFLTSNNNHVICNGRSSDIYKFKVDGNYNIEHIRSRGDVKLGTTLGACKKIGNYLYAVGGQRHRNGQIIYHSDVYRLCLNTCYWEQLYASNDSSSTQNDPPGVNQHQLVYDSKYIYVLGGLAGFEDFNTFKKVYAFNWRSGSWIGVDLLPDGDDFRYPVGRRSFACEQYTANNGDVEAVIVGGVWHYEKCCDMWKLNVTKRQWTCLRRSLPISFYSAESLSNGCMYIFSSYFPINGRANKVLKVWLRVPDLVEMCWDAIITLNPKLNHQEHKELLMAGIPIRFVERLSIPEADDMAYPRIQM